MTCWSKGEPFKKEKREVIRWSLFLDKSKCFNLLILQLTPNSLNGMLFRTKTSTFTSTSTFYNPVQKKSNLKNERRKRKKTTLLKNSSCFFFSIWRSCKKTHLTLSKLLDLISFSSFIEVTLSFSSYFLF